jgi:hypothetical protein
VVVQLEVLKADDGARTGRAWVLPCANGASAAGLRARLRREYSGEFDWLTVYGVGDPRYGAARDAHVASGRPVACWDMGYVGKSRDMGETHTRVSLGSDHPSAKHMDRTDPDPSRWGRLGIQLREDARDGGHVLVVGLGPKSRAYLGEFGWEERALAAAAARFPDRRIVYRPKPAGVGDRDSVEWPHRSEGTTVATALRGASLVICRHSNVAVDACIAGVPVECEGGAALWLYSRGAAPTRAERLDFLHRLCWWQWRFREMERAWKFLLRVSG